MLPLLVQHVVSNNNINVVSYLQWTFTKQDDVFYPVTKIILYCMSKVGFQSDIGSAYTKILIIYDLFKSFHQILSF